ncbi:MAG: hypothetical protein NZM39_00125 [Bernardetiaceae bacterium]|nr:hypothetical protein [Bernardetiaceae bacterium]
MQRQILLGVVLIVLSTQAGFTQQVKPEGGFFKDVVKIGEPVAYWFVLKHPPEMEVRFPDTLYNYKPFELISKQYFHTRLEPSGISIDSAIYTLATFQMDSLLSFALPAIVLQNGDTTLLVADSVSIAVEKTVSQSYLDSAKLIPTTEYFQVNKDWNYFYIAIGAGTILLLAGAIYWLFGKQIRKAWYLVQLRRRFERFMAEFLPYVNSFKDPVALEHALALWKHYLQGLQGIPFITFTSKEIAALLPNPALHQALKQLDIAIYAGKSDQKAADALIFLAKFAEEAYHQKVKEVRSA